MCSFRLLFNVFSESLDWFFIPQVSPVYNETVYGLLTILFFVKQLKVMQDFFHHCQETASALLGQSILAFLKAFHPGLLESRVSAICLNLSSASFVTGVFYRVAKKLRRRGLICELCFEGYKHTYSVNFVADPICFCLFSLRPKKKYLCFRFPSVPNYLLRA
jgi:hypothetical protein